MNNIINLETTSLVLGFNKANGSLENVYSKVSDWYILNRPQLALSWRLMIPIDQKRNNNAWGHEQKKAPIYTVTENSVTFVWDKITSEFGNEHDITITTVCEIEHDQAVFKMNIKNNSEVFVENVYYPYLGDLHRPEGCAEFSFQHGAYTGMKRYELYPKFPNPVGTHSVDFPTLSVEDHINPPMYPFGLVSDEKGNGLYFGITERRIEAVSWHAEYHPGWRNSNDFRVFDEDYFGNKDIYTRFAVGHLPFVAPKNEFNLLPFGIKGYKGNWNVGASCYTDVSKAWNKLPLNTIPDWAKKPHSWLQIHINSPEDELRIKFKDLIRVGEECKKYGVDVIQLVGWNEGGQDRGNPTHSPDPRLGTPEELKTAIKEIQSMGIKVILFAKFVWADQSNENFEEVYKEFSIKDPYNNYYVYKGYQYMTLSQMTNVNTRRLIPMCFGSEKYLEICNREFQKCVDLDADGILYDECLHHSPTLCCFDTSHGHRYGAPSYGWDEKLINGFREIVQDKEFMIAGEAVYDFQHNYYDLSYTRTWGRDHKPTSRYMRPNGAIMTAVIGFHDRGMINQCLLNRYIISYEPYNFKGMLSDYPETVSYGKKMDILRTDLSEYFWYGEFMDKLGGCVTMSDGSLVDSYAVYKGTNDKYGMIICNYDELQSIRVYPKLENKQILTQYRLVDQSNLTSFDSWIDIPPSSAVAII